MDIKELFTRVNEKFINNGYAPVPSDLFLTIVIILEFKGYLQNDDGEVVAL